MNQRGFRYRLLQSSVEKLVDSDETVEAVVMLWNRHRWFFGYAAAAGLAIYVVATLSGFDGLVNRIALAACGVAIAGMSTTNYWVLARTNRGFVLCRSSRIRQFATSLVERLGQSPSIEMVGSTVVTSDWQIDGVEYTLSKRWESTMRTLATGE